MTKEPVEITCTKCGNVMKNHGIKKEKGYLYFVGKDSVQKAKMARRGKKK